jgi:putative membrane protein insertion efficiency factor
MRTILVALIQFYRYLISPWLGQHCRFEPTCSVYALTAIQRHGALHGSVLAAKRLSKCHPWHTGGIDPVPDKKPEINNG